MGTALDGGNLAETHEVTGTRLIVGMLVPLSSFMVAAPLATVDIAVDLPSSSADPQVRPDKPIYLTVKSDLSLTIGDDPLPKESLAAGLDAATGGNKQERIYLR